MRDMRLEPEREGIDSEGTTALLHVCRKDGFLRFGALHRSGGNIMNTTLLGIRKRVQAGLALALCSCLCFIVMANGVAEAQSDGRAGRVQSRASQQGRNLGDLLRPDGSLDLMRPGYRGALNPEGYRLASVPGEEPRFALEAAPGDERWSDAFGGDLINRSLPLPWTGMETCTPGVNSPLPGGPPRIMSPSGTEAHGLHSEAVWIARSMPLPWMEAGTCTPGVNSTLTGGKPPLPSGTEAHGLSSAAA
jgi:hypothetical protein